MDRIQVEWRKCCRYILGLNPRTHSYLLPNLMNTPNILGMIESRFINFIKKGLIHDSLMIKYIFQNSILGSHSYALLNINKILNSYDINFFKLFQTKDGFKL